MIEWLVFMLTVSVLWYLGLEWHQPATKSSKAHDTYMDSLTDAAVEVWKSIKDSSDKSDRVKYIRALRTIGSF